MLHSSVSPGVTGDESQAEERAEEVASLQMRLSIYRRTIDYLEEQRAQFGVFVPPYIRHQLEETRRHIAQLKQELRTLGETVEDRPGDVEVPAPASASAESGPDTAALLRTYRRMLHDKLRFLPLSGLSQSNGPDLCLGEAYVERTLIPFNSSGSSTTPGDLVLPSRARALLEGPPGSGKTTILHRLTLACTVEADVATVLDMNLPWSEAMPLPILISAHDLAASLNSAEDTGSALGLSFLWSMIEEQLQRSALADLTPSFQQALQAGECLVLIDGLDDVALLPSGRALVASVGRFIARYPDNRYVITCRNRGDLSLSGFGHYTLAPLNEVQVDDMVSRWYSAIAQHDGFSTCDDLGERIAVLQGHLRSDERLHTLVATPLVLALCILIHTEGQVLPAARTSIYERLIDLLLDRWDHLRTEGSAPTLAQSLDISALGTMRQRLQLLAPLAYALQSRPDLSGDHLSSLRYDAIEPILLEPLLALGVEYQRAIEQVIPQLLARCCRQGLLIQIEHPPAYAMPSRPLREYLAACELAHRADFPSRARLLSSEPRWHETLLLAVRELSRGSSPHAARELLRLLIEASSTESLLLAAECLLELGDRAGPERAICAEVQRRLITLMGMPICSVAERVRAGMLLGLLGDTRTSGLLPPLVRVAGGSFIFGTREGYEDEGPVQSIHVPAFAIGAYPVTNAEYARFLDDDPSYPRPRYWYDPRLNNPAQPVVGVTWHDAVAYCEWLTRRLGQAGLLPPEVVVRLPSEQEWEKTASWDPHQQVKRRYPWGDEWSSKRANTTEGRGTWTTTPVGCYPDGVSAYGAYEMVGNVWEWTGSVYASYPDSVAPFHEAGRYTLRGSSCASLPTHTRCTYRSRLPPDYWRYHLGFRIVLARRINQEQAGN